MEIYTNSHKFQLQLLNIIAVLHNTPRQPRRVPFTSAVFDDLLIVCQHLCSHMMPSSHTNPQASFDIASPHSALSCLHANAGSNAMWLAEVSNLEKTSLERAEPSPANPAIPLGLQAKSGQAKLQGFPIPSNSA